MGGENKEVNVLDFHRMSMPLRIVSISDGGHVSLRSNYPFEKRMVLIMADNALWRKGTETMTGSAAAAVGRFGQAVYHGAKKAQRPFAARPVVSCLGT